MIFCFVFAKLHNSTKIIKQNIKNMKRISSRKDFIEDKLEHFKTGSIFA